MSRSRESAKFEDADVLAAYCKRLDAPRNLHSDVNYHFHNHKQRSRKWNTPIQNSDNLMG